MARKTPPLSSNTTLPPSGITIWRYGAPPKYNLVNGIFQAGRTKEWAKGSLEEVVQNLVKSWEMELTHKLQLEDFKTIDPDTFSFSVNGSSPMSAQELLKVGSYNALLASAACPTYDSKLHNFESSHDMFHKVFPGGFAWEVLEVFSGPPTVAFKWRHWGEASTTGEMLEVIGVAVAKVNDQLRIGKLEVFYDPTDFLSKIWPAERRSTRPMPVCPRFKTDVPNLTYETEG